MGQSITVRRGCLIVLAASLLSTATPVPARGEDRPAIETPMWVGTGSCAALACHGGRREPLALKGSEYAFSEAYDPHNRAYQVLFDDRSRRIEKNLRGLADLESARPFEDDTCLRCHVYQGYDSKAPWSRSPEFAVADGVSCEGCHGAAGRWLTAHTEYTWQGLSDREKLDNFGMRPTKDLLARGQACTECHVGRGRADVNHDLIAAGHPRLNFEYGNQLAKLPKHWRSGDDKARNPDYEAKVWALGQLIAAKASLDLLETRARNSIADDSAAPWPEFAEYSCFSCHHELVKPGWASANATNALKPGTPQWGTWYLPLAKGLPDGIRVPDPDDAISSIGTIRALMGQPGPDAATIAQRAQSASEELGRVADELNRGLIAPSQVRSMLGRVLKPDPSPSPLDWDGAARQYLAIVALGKAAGEYDPRYADPAVRASLDRLLKNLDLPTTVQGRAGIYDSPYRFDPDRIKVELRSLRETLPKP